MVQPSDEFRTQYQNILPPNALGYRLKLLSQLIERKFQDLLAPFGLPWEEQTADTKASQESERAYPD